MHHETVEAAEKAEVECSKFEQLDKIYINNILL